MARQLIRKMTDEELREICQAKGLKATNQRIEILRIVSAAKNHPSVDEVCEQVRSRIPDISSDTVYRTLSSLEEHKIISRVHHLDDKTRYDPNTNEHHHFVCTCCKEITDFEWPEFTNLKLPLITQKFGHLSQKYAEIRGLCRKCAK
jgi:Fur family transcriptional regulator, peroxide stress response regulator